MIWQDIKQLKTGPRDLRKFGLLVGTVFAALGILLWLRGKGHFAYFLAPGAMLVVAGLVFPKALKPVYIGWMSLALVLGLVVSTVLLTVFFFLVITPVGLIARLVGKDFLRLKLRPEDTTYWIRREQKVATSPADYEKQF